MKIKILFPSWSG